MFEQVLDRVFDRVLDRVCLSVCLSVCWTVCVDSHQTGIRVKGSHRYVPIPKQYFLLSVDVINASWFV